MPLLSKNTLNQKISFAVKVVALFSSNTDFAYARNNFSKNGIFDGVKLISDIQRHSINYSEPHFECQNARCILKKLSNSDKLQAKSIIPTNF